MAELGMPFQGKAWYFLGESCPSNTDTTYPISCKIQDARLGIGDKHEEIRGFDSACACHLHKLVSDFTFHLEYYIQCDDGLLERIVDKNAYCKLQSLGFFVADNSCVQADADKSAFLLCGCKPKTVRISAAFNELYLITVDFSVQNIITDGSFTSGTVNGVGTAPTDLTGAYLGFNIGGSIEKDGSDVAYIVDGMDITFEHGIIDKYDHDSLNKQYQIEGEEVVSGSIDISLDEGGGVHWAEVINQGSFDIVVDLGGSTCPRITLPNCKWKSSEIDISVSPEPLMESAPFTCKPESACTDGFISATP